MLTIRSAQLKIFEENELKKFEDWMLEHLKTFFPAQYARRGTYELRDFIRYGMQRADTYHFTTRRDICKYIDLMMTFGRDFDKDQSLPWASETLKKRRDPEGKMHLLFSLAVQQTGRS